MSPFGELLGALPDFGLEAGDAAVAEDRTLVVRKPDWDYGLALAFQRASVQLLHEKPGLRVLVACSHPRVFTNGRGLQKPRKGEIHELVEFKPADHRSLPFPLHQIERGGGLTFHHPGQFVFYPIVKLTPKTLSLSRMIEEIFEVSEEVLGNWGIGNLSHANKLLGLWHGNKKIASMGIAIEKLATFHGMALNLGRDGEMIRSMAGLSPCGLRADAYISAEELAPLPAHAWETFSDDFLGRILARWRR